MDKELHLPINIVTMDKTPVEKYICIHYLLLIYFLGRGREGRGRGLDSRRRKQARNQFSAVWGGL